MDWIELAVGAFLGGVISIVIDHFFISENTDRKIEYEIENTCLITEKISENLTPAPSLKIQFGTERESEDVQVLTSSVIKIQNVGYTVIESANISPDDPIRIHARDDTRIFLSKIQDTRGMANNFHVTPRNSKYIDVAFSFLNPMDGVKIQVFHSGKTGSALEISGTVIGGPKIKETSHWKKNLKHILIVPAIASMLLGLIVFFAFPWTVQNVLGTPVQLGILNLAVLFLIVFLTLTFVIVYVDKIYDRIMGKLQERVFNDKEW
jgi:sensor histidine kinase regulating citrate/malate metabolism